MKQLKNMEMESGFGCKLGYPFGMPVPGRVRSYSSSGYRYGFGGHEKDDEVHGGWYAFGDYGYDARLGRRPAPDPATKEAPSWTPYRTFYNNPLYWVDSKGKVEYQSHFTVYEATGKVVVETKMANSIMTDGTRTVWDNNACWHRENFYYDYATTTVTTIHADGTQTVKTQTEILYDNGIKDTDYVWSTSGARRHGDTKRETWSDDSDMGIERWFGIWITGGGDGPIAQDFSKNILGSIDFGELRAMLKRGSFMTKAGTADKSWFKMKDASTAKAWVKSAKDNFEGGQKIGDAVNGVKNTNNNSGTREGIWIQRNDTKQVITPEGDTIYEKTSELMRIK